MIDFKTITHLYVISNEHVFLVIKEMSFLWFRCGILQVLYKRTSWAALGRSWPYWRPGRWSVHPGKAPGGSIISSMPIFVLFLSPPETPRILCVPTCKTSQSEQPSIHVPHSMNYNTDCSNSPRLPLVDHTDQFHQTQSTPFYRGLCGTHLFTYSHQNSYTYRSHQPNDFHADSQSANLLHPTGSRPCWIVWKTHSV